MKITIEIDVPDDESGTIARALEVVSWEIAACGYKDAVRDFAISSGRDRSVPFTVWKEGHADRR